MFIEGILMGVGFAIGMFTITGIIVLICIIIKKMGERL